MLKRVFCSVLNLFVIMLHLQLVSSQLPADQVSAMTSIYEIIQNNTAASFVWNNVLKTSNPCSWKGVVCTSDNSSINNISLHNLFISTSEFLPFVCNISTLESLDVSFNKLRSIPYGFFTVCGEISGLKVLDFSANRLNGSLPCFNKGFRALEELDFSFNSLSGEISLQLDGLDSLKILYLGYNQFIGKIPTNLGKLNLLKELELSFNSFTGEIPLDITKHKNLSLINFRSNGISGSIPRELGELTKVQTLDLSNYNLTGGIPASLSNITTLERFSAENNILNGTIPSGITWHLKDLSLQDNKLTGFMPSDPLYGPNLQYVDLSSNLLEGPIPTINSTTLLELRLHNNILRGTLPPSLANLTSLWILRLEFNNFVGAIPPEILQLNLLQELNIGGNSLTGSIPLSIPRMHISYLDLQGNKLGGPIPDSIGNLSSLSELQLGNNQLNGLIPDMPRDTVVMNLSYNLLVGRIPFSLSTSRQLTVLDLSNNRLSGEIPASLTDITSLTQLLLMNNDLHGVVPSFRNGAKVDTRGNKDMNSPSSEITPHTNSRKLSIDSYLLIGVASGFPVGLLISVIAIFMSRRYYSSIRGNLSNPNSIHRLNVDLNKGLKAAADPSNIILKSAFSTFYKVAMPSETTYLVKKINRSSSIFKFPRHKQLLEELEFLGTLSNPNVMIPVAYVLTPHRVYLFYDFVRGTLHDILHRKTGNSSLDWARRYKIAIGVARGLAFLHECSSGHIILLHLSTKTILLKSIDEPQISDIELCKLIHPSTCATSVGYAPPEYGCTERVTGAGNVYSFGVVLLELLTRKPAVSEGTELAKWVLSISNYDQILDSSISESETTSIVVRNQMLGVLDVAIACINISPEMRPNMAHVMQMLLSKR